jgi:hypothetical protein
MGTAKDACSAFLRRHLESDLGDGLIYREAFTADAARATQHHFVHDCGLQTDLNTAPGRGKIAFAYRKTAPAHPETRRAHPRFRKLAA